MQQAVKTDSGCADMRSPVPARPHLNNYLNCWAKLVRKMILHHLQRDSWLISRYHVPCLKDLHKGETVAAAHFRHGLLVHLVIFDSGSIEICLVGPIECQSP